MALRFLGFIVFSLFIVALIDLIITLVKFKRTKIEEIVEDIMIDKCFNNFYSTDEED